jgi:hypothetical protein
VVGNELRGCSDSPYLKVCELNCVRRRMIDVPLQHSLAMIRDVAVKDIRNLSFMSFTVLSVGVGVVRPPQGYR